MKHLNNGACDRCQSLFNKYPNFHSGLRVWFEDFQTKNKEAHISCAGRGYDEQMAFLLRGSSKATYGKSAHNWNAAIDVFEMGNNVANIYEFTWFKTVLEPALPPWLNWYGVPKAPFFELPHIEVRDWKKLADARELRLVEPIPRG